jgi:hypothetical protein
MRANADLTVGAGKFDEAVEPRPVRCIPDPGSSDEAVASVGGAKIVDLMPDNDPEVRLTVRGFGKAIPVRNRDLLHPLHPDRVVHMAKLVDIARPRANRELERPPCHFTCVSTKA